MKEVESQESKVESEDALKVLPKLAPGLLLLTFDFRLSTFDFFGTASYGQGSNTIYASWRARVNHRAHRLAGQSAGEIARHQPVHNPD